MSEEPVNSNDPLQSLTQAFLLNFPLKAARRLEAMSPDGVAALLQQQKVHVIARVMEKLAPQLNLLVLGKLPPELAVKVLELVEVGVALNMLARLPEEDRAAFLALMLAASAQEFRALLDYPENTVGRLMTRQCLPLICIQQPGRPFSCSDSKRLKAFTSFSCCQTTCVCTQGSICTSCCLLIRRPVFQPYQYLCWQ